tara:strand:+ start:408 stop:629 length:222 start_codon:yes stop_codon:yes gene_type:complete
MPRLNKDQRNEVEQELQNLINNKQFERFDQICISEKIQTIMDIMENIKEIDNPHVIKIQRKCEKKLDQLIDYL